MVLNNRTRRRAGFSLIELLAVLGILGLLVGLILPAVGTIREAANRVKCTNNLKQIGVAVLHYENFHGRLPPSRFRYPECDDPSWAWNILPFLDQENLVRG